MALIALIALPLLGGVLAWLAGRRAARWIALAALLADLGLLAFVALSAVPAGAPWLARVELPWIPRFGIALHLGLDGLSLLMAALTLVLGVMAVAASWREIDRRVGFFHFNLMWTLAGVVGVFLALDLFLFFFLWEVMLVPMYFLIAIWGHGRRVYAAIKFFIFTQGSGLLMLVSIVALALLHQRESGVLTFDYFALLDTSLPLPVALWVMLGFFAAFAVKLPAVPFHTWLPDAHTEAPTGGSVVLAAVLLKTGAYGLLRFVLPLFPEASAAFAPAAMALGAAGVLYGAVLAFAQTDFKRLVAYTSVSHMGFVLLGVFAANTLALQGAVMQMIAHGLSTGALFMIAGALQERLHTRDMRQMGGLWAGAPRLGALTLFFAVASLGLPGLANFVGEFLVLLGAFQVHATVTVAAALGLVLAVVYALALVGRVFFGAPAPRRATPDLSGRELGTLGLLMLGLLALGLYPQPLLDTAAPALAGLRATFAAGLP